MKTFLYILFLTFCFSAVNAQKLSFEVSEYNFGNIQELGGIATYRFVYRNLGVKPLIINTVHTSCGCTSPSWTREPVLPEKSGYIDVSFDPRERPGNFVKSITVKSNGGDTILYISGNVWPRPETVAAEYPFLLFDLRLKKTTVNFNKVLFSNTATAEIEVYNPTKANLKIESQNTDYAIVTPKPQILKPGAKGVIKCVFKPSAYKKFDYVQFEVPLFVNTYEYKLTFKAFVAENFTEADKKNPSKMEVNGGNTTVNTGIVNEGEKISCEIGFVNTGTSPLKIRAVRNACDYISVKFPENEIPSGENGVITAEIETLNHSGVQDRYITIVTNSPETQYVTVKLKLNVIKKE